MTEFKSGTPVYHARFGAGMIMDIQEMTIAGSVQSYYVVELAFGDQLMIPVSDDSQICSLRPFEAISDVLLTLPEKLAVDYRQRRTRIEEKINSGNPLHSAEVVRDLAWRDHNEQLTNTDKAFMNSMKKRLVGIITVQTGRNVQEATQWLETRLQTIIRSWS